MSQRNYEISLKKHFIDCASFLNLVNAEPIRNVTHLILQLQLEKYEPVYYLDEWAKNGHFDIKVLLF